MAARLLVLTFAALAIVIVLVTAESHHSRPASPGPAPQSASGDAELGGLWTAFVDTLTAAGMTPPLVAPRAGGGLVLTQSVRKGDKLASIPKKIKLTLESAASTPFGKVIAEVLEQGMANKEALALYLLYELHRKDGASPYASYLETLPASFDVPLFFEPADQALFQGSVASLVSLQRAAVKRVADVVRQVCLMPIGAAVLNCEALSDDEIRWAFFVVHARGQEDASGVFYLQPLADAFRTSSEADAGAGVVSSKAGRTVVTALRDMDAGTEVLLAVRETTAGIRYATEGLFQADRVDFLALEYNPAGVADTGDAFTATVTELLKLAQCFIPGMPAQRLYLGGAFPESFLTCLRLVHLTPREFADVVAFEEASQAHWPDGKRFSLENELAVVSSLSKAMTQGLASYATTAAEDEALLASGTLSQRGTEIVRIRLSEKNLLAYAKSALDELWLAVLRDAARPSSAQ